MHTAYIKDDKLFAWTQKKPPHRPTRLKRLLVDIFGPKGDLLWTDSNPTLENLNKILEVGKDCMDNHKEMPFSFVYSMNLLMQLAIRNDQEIYRPGPISISKDILLKGALATSYRCELDRYYKLKDLTKDSDYQPILTEALGSKMAGILSNVIRGKIPKDPYFTFDPSEGPPRICTGFIVDYFPRVKPKKFPGEGAVIEMMRQHSDHFKTSYKYTLKYEKSEEREALFNELKHVVEFAKIFHIENKGSSNDGKILFKLKKLFVETVTLLLTDDNTPPPPRVDGDDDDDDDRTRCSSGNTSPRGEI